MLIYCESGKYSTLLTIVLCQCSTALLARVTKSTLYQRIYAIIICVYIIWFFLARNNQMIRSKDQSTFHPFEVVFRGSETQLQVGEKSKIRSRSICVEV